MDRPASNLLVAAIDDLIEAHLDATTGDPEALTKVSAARYALSDLFHDEVQANAFLS